MVLCGSKCPGAARRAIGIEKLTFEHGWDHDAGPGLSGVAN